MNRKWWPKRPDIPLAKIQELRAQGQTYKTIAKTVGMSAAGVCLRLKMAVAPAKHRETWQESCIRRMVVSARKRAKMEGVPFTITKTDIPIPTHCPALGLEFVMGTGRLTDYSPTLDRIIPQLGYTKENVWVISWRANRAKSNLSPHEIIRLAEVLKFKLQERNAFNEIFG